MIRVTMDNLDNNLVMRLDVIASDGQPYYVTVPALGIHDMDALTRGKQALSSKLAQCGVTYDRDRRRVDLPDYVDGYYIDL